MRIDIIANGHVKDIDYMRKQLKRSNFIICADGGANQAEKIKRSCDLLIGDFDSIDSALLKKSKKTKTKIKAYPEEKNKSDLELAVDEAVKLKPEEIYIWAALGNSPAHEFFNIFLLLKYRSENIKIIDKEVRIFLIKRFAVLTGLKGKTASFLPLTSKVEKLSLNGFKYNLKNKDLKQGLTLTLSNQIKKDKALIKFKKGILLGIITG